MANHDLERTRHLNQELRRQIHQTNLDKDETVRKGLKVKQLIDGSRLELFSLNEKLKIYHSTSSSLKDACNTEKAFIITLNA